MPHRKTEFYNGFSWERKGNCLRTAAELLISTPEDDSGVLVHAIVNGTGEYRGKKIRHAWLELDGHVIDKSNGHDYVMRKGKYYRALRPSRIKKYPREEALALIKHTGHFGFWTRAEKISALRSAKKRALRPKAKNPNA